MCQKTSSYFLMTNLHTHFHFQPLNPFKSILINFKIFSPSSLSIDKSWCHEVFLGQEPKLNILIFPFHVLLFPGPKQKQQVRISVSHFNA